MNQMNKTYFNRTKYLQDLQLPDFNQCTPSEKLYYYSNKKLREIAKDIGVTNCNILKRYKIIYIISLSFTLKFKPHFKRILDDPTRKCYYDEHNNITVTI